MLPIRIIDIDDRGSRPFFVHTQILEEPAFRFEVVFHPLMKIKMVSREIREHADIKRNFIRTALTQRVRGNLDHYISTAGFDAVAQEFL